MAARSIAAWPSPSERPAPPRRGAKVVLVGPTCGPRWRAFQEATIAATGAPAAEFGYARLSAEPERLAEGLRPGDVVRIEAPDGDLPAIRALYAFGLPAAAAAGLAPLTGPSLEDALSRKGALGSPSQLAFGLEAAARRVAAAASASGARATAAPDDVALAYDKTACLAHLARRGAPVPKSLGAARSFDEAVEKIRRAGLGRAFIKPRHGAAAAGVLALALGGRGAVGYATVEIGDGGRLFATRQVRRLASVGEIRAIVDALAPLGLHLEAWVPKAGVAGKTCDLRLVVLEAEETFALLRTSRSPITNLRLGAERAGPEALRAKMSGDAWEALLATGRTAARLFPGLRSVGLDIAPLTDFRSHVVLEVNAFGDFVKGVRREGRTPQERLLRRMLSTPISAEAPR